ncbi:hypothetical protein [Paracoccus aestuarii]|nr:hypothetical protein [Paracoccus aestuarii]
MLTLRGDLVDQRKPPFGRRGLLDLDENPSIEWTCPENVESTN